MAAPSTKLFMYICDDIFSFCNKVVLLVKGTPDLFDTMLKCSLGDIGVDSLDIMLPIRSELSWIDYLLKWPREFCFE